MGGPDRSRAHQGNNCCKIATGTVATDRQAVWIDSERLGVLINPLGRAIAILARGWRRVFRCQPIVDGERHASGTIGKGAADRVVGIEISDHEPPGMKEDQGRERLGRGGPLGADRDRSARTGNRTVQDLRDGLGGRHLSEHCSSHAARLGRGKLVRRGALEASISSSIFLTLGLSGIEVQRWS